MMSRQCLAGGFNLTKVISNKKVIQSVPEYNIRNDVKNVDLGTSLPLKTSSSDLKLF